jgi:hypothetical protein
LWYKNKGTENKKEKLLYCPAMLLLPGIEKEYTTFMQVRTQTINEHYKDQIHQLTPGTSIMSIPERKDDDIFGHGSTMSAAITIKG